MEKLYRFQQASSQTDEEQTDPYTIHINTQLPTKLETYTSIPESGLQGSKFRLSVGHMPPCSVPFALNSSLQRSAKWLEQIQCILHASTRISSKRHPRSMKQNSSTWMYMVVSQIYWSQSSPCAIMTTNHWYTVVKPKNKFTFRDGL